MASYPKLTETVHPKSFLIGWNLAIGDTKTFTSDEEVHAWIQALLENTRISFDAYMMRIAHIAALRSIDTSTKHGCVIADSKNRIVSIGYNGPPYKVPPDLIEWTRPEKYDWMLHAESNAILFSNKDLEGCTIYVTGPSCSKCFLEIVQKGIKRCVFGPRMAKCVDVHAEEVRKKIAESRGIEIVYMDCL